MSIRAPFLAILSVLSLGSACGGESARHQPALTADLMAPAAAGLVPGRATQAEVAAAFEVTATVKDESLGGDAKVEYGGQPAIKLTLTGEDILRGTAWLMPDAGGEPRLQSLELTLPAEAGACAWILDNIGKHPEASRRAGSNRKFGPQKGGAAFSGGSPDGTLPADIDCMPSVRNQVATEIVNYALVPAGGRSTRIQTR
jgi:hypothetical protein